jgi:hypothetical protein
MKAQLRRAIDLRVFGFIESSKVVPQKCSPEVFEGRKLQELVPRTVLKHGSDDFFCASSR